MRGVKKAKKTIHKIKETAFALVPQGIKVNREQDRNGVAQSCAVSIFSACSKSP
jgi:hypothetical protein